jgi:hypothetical protein
MALKQMPYDSMRLVEFCTQPKMWFILLDAIEART